jgi:hypothetical protein
MIGRMIGRMVGRMIGRMIGGMIWWYDLVVWLPVETLHATSLQRQFILEDVACNVSTKPLLHIPPHLPTLLPVAYKIINLQYQQIL